MGDPKRDPNLENYPYEILQSMALSSDPDCHCAADGEAADGHAYAYAMRHLQNQQHTAYHHLHHHPHDGHRQYRHHRHRHSLISDGRMIFRHVAQHDLPIVFCIVKDIIASRLLLDVETHMFTEKHQLQQVC